MTTDAFMIFDTASLYFRSFFGVKTPMTAPDGTPVNAVRGLLDSMAYLIRQYQPTRVACAWDNDWRPTWRVALVPSYKAHRLIEEAPSVVGAGGKGAASGQAEEAPDALTVQIPIILEVLAALGLPVIGVDDHEADDVLGSLAAQNPGNTLVVTGDRDLFQLADETTTVLYVGKGISKHEQVTSEWVENRYSVSAAQYVDFAVLRGDASDGLPGVKGIGEKSAASLIASYGSLEGIMAAASDPDSRIASGLRSKLAAGLDYIGPATEVVAVVRDLALPPAVTTVADWTPDEDALAALSQRWALGSSLERFREACAAASS